MQSGRGTENAGGYVPLGREYPWQWEAEGHNGITYSWRSAASENCYLVWLNLRLYEGQIGSRVPTDDLHWQPPFGREIAAACHDVIICKYFPITADEKPRTKRMLRRFGFLVDRNLSTVSFFLVHHSQIVFCIFDDVSVPFAESTYFYRFFERLFSLWFSTEIEKCHSHLHRTWSEVWV